MSLRKRILIHGLLAAVPLALIGYVLALLAGLWASSQSALRSGPAVAASGDEVTAAFVWKLPLFLAIGGFAFVAIGEVIRTLWSTKANVPQKTQEAQKEQRS